MGPIWSLAFFATPHIHSSLLTYRRFQVVVEICDIMVIQNGMNGMDIDEEFQGDILKSGYHYGSYGDAQIEIDDVPVSQEDAWAVIS